MALANERIVQVYLENEMRESYIDYSMSVIVSRALPDVRDGLKPVHRRILYAMQDLGLAPNRAPKKSARIVGEVLGKYHPHGDSAVYDAMTRMVQDFSLRYPLVNGQGNFGSVDGDSAAAMRYTEARLSPIGGELLKDIDKGTVDFAPNFDETLKEPKILPTMMPNLLANGSSGIAVGMATNIPPHNLGELVVGINALMDDPRLPDEELIRHIPAPDFPTGGIIYGYSGVRNAYLTGRGRVVIRARANIEETKTRENIIITELPYQVNKATLLERIADLVRDKKIEGIYDIRDESDRDGMRVVIELKRDINPEVVLNQLFKMTQMQNTFGVILLALVDGMPRVLNLKQMLQYYIEHAITVVVRKTKFELDEAEKRAHILEGLKIALDNLDEIISLIRQSRDPVAARQGLIKLFKMTEIQAKAILDMRLQRLTGLERKKIEEEYKEIMVLIKELQDILAKPERQQNIVKTELARISDKYSDERRTEVIHDAMDFSLEDMIAEEDMVITISHQGFIKRFPVSGFRRQGRGGRGSTGAGTKEEDFVEHLFIASTHHWILFFTDKGRCYWLKVHELPQAGKAAKGRAIVNLLQKEKDENITTFVAVKEFLDDQYILLATRNGTVKKTALSAYGNPRKKGINAINVLEGDSLIEALLTDGTHDIVLGSHNGMSIRFRESDARPMGRTAKGVSGMRLSDGDYIVGVVAIRRDGTLLMVTQNGYGKRSSIADYRLQKRAGKGIITVKTTEKVGKMVSIMDVGDDDDLMIITSKGVVIRQHVADIRTIGRNTQGVRLIRLDEGDTVGDVARVPKNENGNGENGEEENAADGETAEGKTGE
jgi:DNA gyrase subunit A